MSFLEKIIGKKIFYAKFLPTFQIGFDQRLPIFLAFWPSYFWPLTFGLFTACSVMARHVDYGENTSLCEYVCLLRNR